MVSLQSEAYNCLGVASPPPEGGGLVIDWFSKVTGPKIIGIGGCRAADLFIGVHESALCLNLPTYCPPSQIMDPLGFLAFDAQLQHPLLLPKMGTNK